MVMCIGRRLENGRACLRLPRSTSPPCESRARGIFGNAICFIELTIAMTATIRKPDTVEFVTFPERIRSSSEQVGCFAETRSGHGLCRHAMASPRFLRVCDGLSRVADRVRRRAAMGLRASIGITWSRACATRAAADVRTSTGTTVASFPASSRATAVDAVAGEHLGRQRAGGRMDRRTDGLRALPRHKTVGFRRCFRQRFRPLHRVAHCRKGDQATKRQAPCTAAVGGRSRTSRDLRGLA
jgi:hypothetical protein